ncbi:uncharacterized protein LOC102060904 isoform X2 [Zonotrichia albicollis]|uniref:uncharacterized protein LOC102060904 isoform X2 n=1 Tax=Zonotrichia albicollis TaxID=44394 RepID=UPI003D80BA81
MDRDGTGKGDGDATSPGPFPATPWAAPPFPVADPGACSGPGPELVPGLLRQRSVPKVSPVSMELQELSPALLQPQITMVAVLGELLDTLPSLDEMTLLVSPLHLYWDLMDFTNELRDSLYCIDDTWRHRNFISDDDDPPASLSQALATHKSSRCTRWICLRMKAWKWPRSVAALEDRWAELARRATKLSNACRDLATKAADRAATATTRARELQDEAARYWTAQENMVKFCQALGREEGAEVVVRHEAQVRREAMVAASESRRATMVRQRLEVALGLLERLVAACDEATAFPRELQRLLRDIEAALKGTNEASPKVSEDLVAKVAVAEQLWEANARLAQDHLVGTLQDIIKFYFHDGSTICSAREVAEQCQRAIEDIPRLLRSLECLQSVPRVSPVSMEPQELSLALLQPQVTVVAILGELLATLLRRAEMTLLVSTVSLYRDLEDFTRELQATLYPMDGTWWRPDVPVDDDDPPVSLSQALAAYKSTPVSTWFDVKMEASEWQRSVDVVVDRRAQLARKATKLHHTCRVMVTEAGYRAATATARARELQDEAARYGTAQENMVELGQALGREEGAEVVAMHGAQVRREAMVAAREATRATMVRQRLEVSLGLLEHLVTACDEATVFPRELQRLLWVTRAILKGTNELFPSVPNALVAKVAVAEQLWKTNTRLAKDHLGKTLPDVIEFLFNGGLDSPSACGVAERCQRATEDIPRLLRPPECPQGVPKVSPLSMELQELSLALLQPQVTIVAILGELLATLPRRDEEMLLLMSPLHLYWDLEEFTNELRTTLYCIDDTWRRHNVTMDDDDPVTSLSQALAAYKSMPWISQNHVTMAVRKWQGLVAALVDRWAELARKASELRNTWREAVTEAATGRARELQAMAARDGTAQENMVELGQALGWEEGAEVVAGHESWVRREAMVAASEATRATMERQWLDVSLGLLEHLVAACDEATAFPRELQRRVGDIKAALKGTNEASSDVPNALIAKVAVAKWLWEANARLVKDHLGGTLQDIIDFYYGCAPDSPRCRGVAEWCQRAIEDIPRLLRPPERPQGVPKLSPALLQPQVTVVAILGELLATLPSLDAMMMLLLSPSCLYWDLIDFTRELQTTLYHFDAAWWCRSVTFNGDDPPTSLSRTVAAYKSTRWTTSFHVRRATSKWQRSVSVLVNSWAQLARAATELRNTCRDLATKAADRAATATTRARALQDEAAHDGTGQENMVELVKALGGEEGAEVVSGHEAQVRREARVAASEATRATMVRQRLEASLGLLERLVTACDEASAFPRELQRLLRDTKATLEGTKTQSINVAENLVAKVAVAERLWEANAHLAKDHLVATLDDITKFLFPGRLASPSACEVAEWCQRVIEDIPRLLEPLEHPQSISTVSPETMEIEELSLALLQPQVTVVATLCELLATLPNLDEEMLLPMSPEGLYSDLQNFTSELQESLYYIDDTWWRRNVTWDYDDPPTSDNDDDDDDSSTYDGDDPPTSLSQALAAYESTPWTRCKRVAMEASKWQWSVSVLVDRWAELVGKASKLRKACRNLATKAADRAATATSRARELQAMAAHYGTAQENMVELAQALGGEEGAEVVAGHESWVRREARVAASKATRATMVRQRLEVALGLLERLVAACDEATAFLEELQHRVGDIKAALKGISEASPNVPKDLVAKVAVAERLCEANARLAKDHLLGALDDIIAFDCRFLSRFADDVAEQVAERCQRAIKDIPRLLRYLDHPQGVPKVSPMTMELQELFPALLQPQVIVVAILGELLATLPRRDGEATMSLQCLRWDLEEYSRDLRATLHCTDDTWWRNIVTSDDDGPVTSLSQALAAFRSTPWTPQNRVTMAASKWQEVISVLVDSWAKLSRKATQLRNTWREVAAEAADMVATATAQARELQDEAARDGTAQENMEELGQALGREEGAEVVAGHGAQVRREARVAASKATRATIVRQRLEVALGLLERLVAACDAATAFPRELQCRVGDIEATLKETNVASPDVPEDLVVKVAMAEWLWEANARLVKDHLEGTLNDINAFYYGYGPNSPHCRGVAERCQRVIKDIPRLLRPLECPLSVPRVSPMGMEPQELSPALLQPQVIVVAIVGELLATLPNLDGEMLLVSPGCLYQELEEFTRDLWVTLYHTDATWCCRNVTSNDDDRLTSLSQALAAYKSIPWTTWDDVIMVASKWQRSMDEPVNSWAELARKATKLRNTWKEVVTDAADRAAFYTARARALQDEAARYGTAQENIVELGQALGREEGAKVVAGYEAWVRREIKVSASQATRATMERQQAGVALGLLERLVAACDEATAFPRELQRLVRDIEAALKETNEASPDVPEDMVAKVADAERLWEANACLANDHLAETVRDIIKFLFPGGPASLSAHEVAERCQRAIEDIPRLLQPLECPQGVPKESPVTMELQEVSPPQLSPALLQPQVTVVAILGELLATLPSEDEINLLFMCPSDFYRDLKVLTWELQDTRHCIEDWRHRTVTWDDDDPVTSLSQALAAWESTPGTSQKRLTVAARNWQGLVNALVNSWARLARAATKLPNACRDLATKAADRAATATARARELQDAAAHYGTAQENMVELVKALGGEEGAEVVAGHEAQVWREARVAASEARRAIMVRQQLEASLGLLESLGAACDEASAFPRELQRLLKAIKAALKGTNEASPKVSEDLVAKVAVAEQLWEANARLAKDHLEGALQGSVDFYFNGDGPTSPSACGVAEQCQRAMEYIARLLRPPEHPQSVPKVSPVSMELQELSPALLQPEVTAVAILGELLASLPRWDEEMNLHVPKCLYWDLKNFTSHLCFTLYCTDNTWWRHSVTSGDDDPVTSLSRALAACESTRGTTWDNVIKAASKWQRSVSMHVNRWAELARTATKLRNACREVVTEAADREASARAWARDLQALAARDGTVQENMVELGEALVREEGAKVEDRYETQVRREARVAAREATRATMERQQAEAALGLLEHLVAACDEATAFPQELQRLLWDTKAALKGRSEASPNVPDDLVAKVAMAEQVWEAKRHLAKDHLLRAVPGTSKFYFTGGPASPSACEVAERCQRAIEDIPRLLRPPEHPQSVPNVSPVSMELQETSLSQLLEALVSVVATLGKVTATVTGPHRGVRRCVPPKLLHAALRIFTWSLRKALEHPSVTSLGQALATLGATPGATWADVRAAGSAWRELVSACEERWKQLVEEITKLRDACEDAALAWARDQQDKATRRGTAGDNLAATAQQLMVALDRDEEASVGATRDAQVAMATNEAMGEAVVASRRARAAIRRRHWAEVALEPLQRLVDACDKGTEFISYMQCQLRDIEAALEGTKEASPNVPEDLVAKVAKAEQLWEASACLFKHHLLGTLGDIHDLLLSPYGGRGGPDGPGSHAVTKQCQKAIEDIPKLLQDSDITTAMSSSQ